MIHLLTLGGIDLRDPSGPLPGRIVQSGHLALPAVLVPRAAAQFCIPEDAVREAID